MNDAKHTTDSTPGTDISPLGYSVIHFLVEDTIMAAAPASTATTWKLDPAHSTVEFSAKHMMFTTVKGRFADVEGTITVNGTTPDTARVEATMKAASLDTRTEQR